MSPGAGRMKLLRRVRSVGLVLVAFLGAFVSGCGQSGGGTGTVSGRVQIDGKPLPGEVITFVSLLPGTNAVAVKADDSGQYGPIEVPAGELEVSVDNRSMAPPPPHGNFDPYSTMKRVSPELRQGPCRGCEAPATAPSSRCRQNGKIHQDSGQVLHGRIVRSEGHARPRRAKEVRHHADVELISNPSSKRRDGESAAAFSLQ